MLDSCVIIIPLKMKYATDAENRSKTAMTLLFVRYAELLSTEAVTKKIINVSTNISTQPTSPGPIPMRRSKKRKLSRLSERNSLSPSSNRLFRQRRRAWNLCSCEVCFTTRRTISAGQPSAKQPTIFRIPLRDIFPNS